jgi:hypothetical protein
MFLFLWSLVQNLIIIIIKKKISQCVSCVTLVAVMIVKLIECCTCTDVIPPRDLHVILTRLAGIELELKNLSRLVHTLVTSQNCEASTDLPDNVSLPVESVDGLHAIDESLQSKETMKAVVCHLNVLSRQ